MIHAVHIGELEHSAVGRAVAARFGINLEYQVPLQWWIQLPEWVCEEVRAGLYDVRLTLPPCPPFETAHVYNPWVPK